MKKKHNQWLKTFFENCKQMNRSSHTIKNYRADIEKFIRWYEYNYNSLITNVTSSTISNYSKFIANGHSPISLIKPKSRLKRIFFKLVRVQQNTVQRKFPKQSPLSVSSRKRHLSSIRNFFEFQKQTHEDKSKTFRTNPVKTKIHSIKLKDIDINHTRILLPSEWQKIKNCTYRLRERLITKLLYHGGFRLSELCNLREHDFNKETKTVTFSRKGGYVHSLRIQNSDDIFRDVDSFIKTIKSNCSDKNPYLFKNRNGNRISSKGMYNLIMKIYQCAKLSKELTPHSFRKACATNLYRKTKDLLLVRDYLNHKDAMVTQSYILYTH